MGAGTERELLEAMFRAAIAAAQPDRLIAAHLPERPAGRVVVIGAGKASAAMAAAVERAWTGPLEGLVVTRYGHAVPTDRIEIVEASHPVPDEAGERAARRLLDLVAGLGPDDLVLCLISGGGSALLAAPGEGMDLADERAVNRELLRSGAPIGEMNVVRRHLSAIKGGRLAAACHPARLVTLALSDVPGDDPADIASGPTVPDPTTCADALAIIERYGMTLPEPALNLLRSGRGESVKPGDPRLAGSEFRMIATPQMSLEAAAAAAPAGLPVHILGDAIQGEAKDVGAVLGAIALQVARRGQPFQAPCLLLSGGETTVTLPATGGGTGRGGRNVEFLMALGKALDGAPGIHALAGDTDGADGAEEIAGAYLPPDAIARGHAVGLPIGTALARHDGHGFFEAIGTAVVTGPTLTNVNDVRLILVTGDAGG